jgi:hypothetical protein
MRKTDRVNFRASVPFGDLAQQLVDELSHAALMKLIKDIDARVADFDFTLKLRDFFIQEVREEVERHGEQSNG